MFSRQNKGQNNRISDRILQVGMFAASVATAGILYVLCKFLMINDSSVSGEIILNGTQAEQVVHGSPITAFLFSYFGAFTFLIPLMLLYCFYLVLKNRSRLFVPDFFRVGLRVLGFNILILGLCAAFSRTFSFGVTGGGGVLGDYINLSLLSLIPGMAVSLCSLLLSFIGICVFFAVSPLQLADGIGSFIMRFIDGKKGEEKEVGQEESVSTISEMTDDESNHIEPSFEEEIKDVKKAGLADASIFSKVAAMPKAPFINKTKEEKAEDTVPTRNIFDRTEPKFSSFDKEEVPLHNETQDDFLHDPFLANELKDEKSDNDSPRTIITRNNDKENFFKDDASSFDKEPSTIITKGYDPIFATGPEFESKADNVDDTGSSTFISYGSGAPQDDYVPKAPVSPDPAIVSTHIFSGEPVESFSAKTEFSAGLDEQDPVIKDEVDEAVEENVIQFSDFAKKGSFELNDLPASFLPSAQEDDGALTPVAHTLSEKDGSYQYESAERGVLSVSGKEHDFVADKNAASSSESFNASLKQDDYALKEENAEVKASLNDGDGQGFFGKPQNSSASNLPSYIKPEEEKKAAAALSTVTVPHHSFGSWRPSFDLLTPSHNVKVTSPEDLEQMAGKINSCLASFKIKAQVARYNVGPIITRYDLMLAPGTKTATIINLSQDLCRELMVRSVRVVSNIPGTQFVGLEIPNPHRKMITLRDMADAGAFNRAKGTLPICLGSSVTGEPVMVDLAAAPHLLISGTTGSGKSAGLNCFLISLLMQKSPEELRLILIDPKRIEFSLYNNLPHLITPVISDVAEKTSAALRWCIDEMERRYALIEAIGVRKISEYNELIEEARASGRRVYDPAWTADMGGEPPVLAPLPSIVIVIEEYADLLAQTSGRKKNVENSPEMCINRLAAKARAAGMHIILATQTPRADVVTGVIKANMPSRVAFTVQSKLDSTIILDEQGAEKLLGYGDMLCKFTGVNGGQTFRAHGAFLSNDDVERVVEAWKEHGGEPDYIEGVTELPEEENDGDDFSSEPKVVQLDKLFDQAAAYTREHYARKQKYPSISDFQSTFGVGYPRAKKIVAQLIREGVMED